MIDIGARRNDNAGQTMSDRSAEEEGTSAYPFVEDLRPFLWGTPVKEHSLGLAGRVIRRLVRSDHIPEDRGDVRGAHSPYSSRVRDEHP